MNKEKHKKTTDVNICNAGQELHDQDAFMPHQLKNFYRIETVDNNNVSITHKYSTYEQFVEKYWGFVSNNKIRSVLVH